MDCSVLFRQRRIYQSKRIGWKNERKRIIGCPASGPYGKRWISRAGKFPFGANGKALTQGERKGFVKIIAEENTGIVLGGAIIGPHATDLIHEVAVAVKNKLTMEQVINTVHAHPTTAEAVHEALLATTSKGAIHFAE